MVKEKIFEDFINYVLVMELVEKNDLLRWCDEIEVSDCVDIDSDIDSMVVGGVLIRFEGFIGSCKGRWGNWGWMWDFFLYIIVFYIIVFYINILL